MSNTVSPTRAVDSRPAFSIEQHLIFVDGKWIEPSGRERKAVIDPSTGEALTTIATG